MEVKSNDKLRDRKGTQIILDERRQATRSRDRLAEKFICFGKPMNLNRGKMRIDRIDPCPRKSGLNTKNAVAIR